MIEEWGRGIKTNFNLLNQELQVQGILETTFREVLASMISSLQSVVHGLDSKIQLLALCIGENQVASDGGSLTCWDALKQLQEEMENIQPSLLEMEQTVEKLQQTDASVHMQLETLGI
jgi:prefoldin subunit 5